MVITVCVGEAEQVVVRWPTRLSEEVREVLFWALDAVDGIDHIVQGNYTTALAIAPQIIDTKTAANLVANALLDNEQLAHLLTVQGLGSLEVRVFTA